MPKRFTTRVARGHIDNYDGQTLGVIVVTDDGASAATADVATVADIVGEIDTADAPGYTRAAIDAVFDPDLGLLKRDPLYAVPAVDLDGAAAVGGVWFVAHPITSGSEAIAFLEYTTHEPGTVDWDIDPADGIAVVDDTADFSIGELSDVDMTTTPPTADQALVFDGSAWVPGPVAGAILRTGDAVIASAATDGTSDEFGFLLRDPTATASGIAPDGWVVEGSTGDAAAFGAFLAMLGGSGKFYLPGEGKLYELTTENYTDPWVPITATIITTPQGMVLADGSGDAALLEGLVVNNQPAAFGLFADRGSVGQQLRATEGILDRHRYVSAAAESNVDIEDLGAATFTAGDLRFVDGNSDPVDECNIWLFGQTDPAENGHYKVADDFTATKIPNPDTFDPPGQGAMVFVDNPDSPDHGRTYRWFDHDPRQNMRAVDSETAIGDWLLVYDPTATGGGTVDVDDLASLTHGATSKTAPVDGDELLLVDSAASNAGKKLSWANLKATLAPSDIGAVPTSRTFAGLDLSADRTVAAVLAALGIWMSWRAVSGRYTHSHIRTGAGNHNASRCYYVPIWLPSQVTIDRIGVTHEGTATTTGGYRVGLYSATSAGLPGSLIVDAGVIDLSAFTSLAVKYQPGALSQAVGPGLFYVAAARQTTGSAPSVSIGNPIHPAPSTDNTSNGFFYEDSVSSGLPSTASPASTANAQAPVLSIRIA